MLCMSVLSVASGCCLGLVLAAVCGLRLRKLLPFQSLFLSFLFCAEDVHFSFSKTHFLLSARLPLFQEAKKAEKKAAKLEAKKAENKAAEKAAYKKNKAEAERRRQLARRKKRLRRQLQRPRLLKIF